ncbi:hypothetical protein R1flu_003668 [Riccia fluitans]|uniref:Uncharacterized protein n=1 Tax=Riccia fluitans TaxID=41844 RepID=A0ABD1Y9T9_9MARC
METSAKAPKEEEPNTTDPVPEKEDPNSEVEPKRRRSKRRRSSFVTPTDKPQARKKTQMMKKETIDLSDEKAQEAKREEETNFTEGTS